MKKIGFIQKLILIAAFIASSLPFYAQKSYSVGDTGPGGGIIFYINQDKTTKNTWTYLEAAPMKAEFWAQWGAYTYAVPQTDTSVGSGKRNTELLNAYFTEQGETYRAAQLCRACTFGGYNDWFLPSKDELDLMYRVLHRKGLGDFAKNWYWSSSGYSAEGDSGKRYAWYQSFDTGFQTDYFRFVPYLVRPIRMF